jgi:citrate lyase alpha subunit
MTVFNAVSAALASSGVAVLVVAGSSVSETFQAIFEAIAEAVLGILGAIAEFFSSLFG